MIAVVGSRSLPATVEVVSAVVGVMAATNEGFGVRAAVNGEIPSTVELAVIKLCDRMHRTIRTFEPITGSGRASVYERDFRLVDAASRVVAFFPLDSFMAGGTGHVVKAALDRGVEVEAYALDGDHLILMGSDEAGLHSGPEVLAQFVREADDHRYEGYPQER